MNLRRVLTTALSLLLSTALLAQTPFVLQDGTPVRLRLNRNLSSADAQVGETVDFEVLDEVRVNDIIVISRGATALATVTEARPKKSMGRAGKLNVNIDSVRLVSGEKIPLRGIQDAKGGGHTGAMTGAMVATTIVFFPAAPLFLFMKGKDITIPKGHEVTVYVNGDVRLDPSRFSSASVTSTAPNAPSVKGKIMKNEDVLALKKAGFSDQLIVEKIKGSQTDFRLDTQDLLELRNAGVSDSVITVMVQARRP